MEELIKQIKEERNSDLMTVSYELSKSTVYRIVDICEKLNISEDEVIELVVSIADKTIYKN